MIPFANTAATGVNHAVRRVESANSSRAKRRYDNVYPREYTDLTSLRNFEKKKKKK